MSKKETVKNYSSELKNLPTVSARIRFLDSEEMSRGDISRLLTKFEGKLVRYQWVRNVLITEVKTPKV